MCQYYIDPESGKPEDKGLYPDLGPPTLQDKLRVLERINKMGVPLDLALKVLDLKMAEIPDDLKEK